MTSSIAPSDSSAAPSSLKALLGRYGLRPRKALGQHFLVDRGALARIVAAADLREDDTVIEVGPGPGILTRELLPRAGRVIAVEKDERMAALLAGELGNQRKLAVVPGDILQLDLEELLLDHGGAPPYKVVANLPYYAAAPIIRHFLEATARPRLLVVMLQREVAQRVVARPGAMGLLSVATQLYAAPRLVSVVRAGSFYPAPKVDSAIVRLDVRERPQVEADDVQGFFRVVRAGFSAPRKQLANSLAQGLGMERLQVALALEAAGLSPRRRAEGLSLEEWAVVCQALRRMGGP